MTGLADADASDGFRESFLAGDALGTWLSIGHPALVEAAARAGFDYVAIDTEHTTMSLETVAELVRTAAGVPGDLAVFVRPASNDPVRIKRVLDIGVDGIIVPKIDTVDDARELISATRYPPNGERGVASGRAAGYGEHFVDYVEDGHADLLVVAQIESAAGVENAAEIADVDGVDSLFIGPADLSASLGVFAEWDAPELADAMARVVEAGNAAGLPVGTLTVRAEDIAARAEHGFDYQIAGKDMTSLIESGERIRERYAECASE
ncbi:HpcH/HpaI aldolase family protein [Natronorubrum daqingense]|uniref:Aldolase n=1 Tax=Natronorubrum daqingense TaxID=588898 RepID=A0A1N7ETN6_9EURY|nr:aldolase/citrate lyase family protein [Natronorubrum daqingense]APX97723.1 aldolase [Natronorubrum daqingense]SIR91422.1 4-hydroxy-2-oxoheptanedioate aldolase [Natronorubrum daqingense]